MMGKSKRKLAELRTAVERAEAAGTISTRTAAEFWNIVGEGPRSDGDGANVAAVATEPEPEPEPEPAEATVTVTLRVRNLNRYSRTVALPYGADREIERALSGIAGRANVEVIRGSVQTRVGEPAQV